MKTRILVIRLEYDACRRELEILSGNSLSMEKQNDLEKYKNKYEQLKCSVQVKLQLLDENQVRKFDFNLISIFLLFSLFVRLKL
mgnify:CR=1 FL=1